MNKIKTFLFKKRKISRNFLITFIAFCLCFSCFLVYDNFSLDVEKIKIEDTKAENLKGLKIAHVSDYHNRKSEITNKAIFKALDEEKPDLIFITGDLIDKSKTDIDTSLSFVSELCEHTSVYYVTGNHECNVSIEDQRAFDDMIKSLKDMGVFVLRQSRESIALPNGSKVNIYGIDDPYFHCSYSYEIDGESAKLCDNFKIDKNEYNILLAHHPEQLPVYAEYGFDLVFSGHAHGGQGRIVNQGLIAPDQGFFPEYTGGEYKEGNTTLILSRGIGNSIIPVRVFNKPHLIFVEF